VHTHTPYDGAPFPHMLSTSLLALGSVQQLSVCQGGACMRGGSKIFTEVAKALASQTPEDEFKIINCGCLGPCPRGVAVRALGGSSGKGTFTLPAFGDGDFLLALENAADVLSDDFALDVSNAKAALIAKHSGDVELASGDWSGAIARYGEAIESQLGGDLLAQAREAERPAQLPIFGLTKGLAAEREAERLRPPRVRWLFEAFIRRCEARLASGDPEEVEAALGDAEAATALCSLADEGYYRKWDAADAIGDEDAASAATAELSRLGYSLEPGKEGEQDANAKPAVKLDYWGRPMA
jgi:hypothetical protein